MALQYSLPLSLSLSPPHSHTHTHTHPIPTTHPHSTHRHLYPALSPITSNSLHRAYKLYIVPLSPFWSQVCSPSLVPNVSPSHQRLPGKGETEFWGGGVISLPRNVQRKVRVVATYTDHYNISFSGEMSVIRQFTPPSILPCL